MSEDSVVLDSSALLAHFHEEPGADAVEAALLRRPLMSSVNWCEVLDVAARRGKDPEGYLALVDVVPLTLEHARASVRYRLPGLSLGDRCCLALADTLSSSVLTADSAWERVGGPAEVQLIR
ncbi:type II toxin-antitoxin system VapC family toxin [Quadrisphaera sp. DSM 44207]|uniref:type II toxin-antitoxin system VapC family toxin n=1 Tax=Quadrisphaera sp. DSM 44207 TaxID=1881057 RepID=UPI00088FB70D|nr:type II toxin-antitoxin system VapC family toxin [Quadrisphaera sp. DSM 44207]SDQ88233.1 PIN domain nuclease, a component of toxin-antitoxin system (PIN domain) [Quadrisphaera sp. DSM 44207]